jgi:hypothetical protein
MTYSPEDIIINTLKKVSPPPILSCTGQEIKAEELFLQPAVTSKARMIVNGNMNYARTHAISKTMYSKKEYDRILY